MKTYNELIQVLREGVYDRGIFKAFFLAGGPGSGKSYVAGHATGGLGLKLINSDDAFERGIRKAGMSFDLKSMDQETFDKAMEIRNRGKGLTNMKQSLAVEGRLGLVIDGTGRDYDKIVGQSESLKMLGYDCYMIFVNTSLDTALERNAARPRKLPEDVVVKSWKQVQSNMGKFQNYFGQDKFVLVDNNDAGEDLLLKVYKRVRKYVERPIDNYKAKQWMERELQLKAR